MGYDSMQSLGQYGPAGMIVEGMVFETKNWAWQKSTFEWLDHALTLLKREHFEAYLVLLSPYLGDPGDHTIVDGWRKKRPGLAKWHDYAVKKLAKYLRHKNLCVPKVNRMTTRKPENVAERNDELYSLYLKIREEGEGKTRAVKDAAAMCDYGLTRAWEIVQLREGAKVK